MFKTELQSFSVDSRYLGIIRAKQIVKIDKYHSPPPCLELVVYREIETTAKTPEE